MDSVVTDIDAGPSMMAIQFRDDNFTVVNNLTLSDTHRSGGIAVDVVESFTMTNSILGRSETGITFSSKYAVLYLFELAFISNFPLPRFH